MLTALIMLTGMLSAAPAVADVSSSQAHGIIKATTGADAGRVSGTQRVKSFSLGLGHDATGKVLDNFAQQTANGVRMMATITDRSQRVVSYAFGIPAGAKVKAQPDGSLVVSRAVPGRPADVEVFGNVAAPWAVDANGQVLSTSYTYSHGLLKQTVDLTHAAFPVVSDPWVTWGWFIYINFSRWETFKVAHSSSYGGLASTLCGMIAPAVGAVACGIFYGWVLIDLYDRFNQATQRYRTCATILLNYAFIYNGTVLRRC